MAKPARTPPPGGRVAAKPAEDNFQAPLGSRPSYDEVVDQAVEYTFPCSDPIAIETCCHNAIPHPSQPPRPLRSIPGKTKA